MYETGECLKDLNEIRMIALQKKPKAAECINHRTYSKDSSEDTAMTD
jgi:hypothetical protein